MGGLWTACVTLGVLCDAIRLVLSSFLSLVVASCFGRSILIAYCAATASSSSFTHCLGDEWAGLRGRGAEGGMPSLEDLLTEENITL